MADEELHRVIATAPCIRYFGDGTPTRRFGCADEVWTHLDCTLAAMKDNQQVVEDWLEALARAEKKAKA